jgi:diphthamide synthase (EF-2-diphthine--ammonia ligase)
MSEFGGLLIVLAGFLALIVFVETKILKAIRLGKEIAAEVRSLLKKIKKNPYVNYFTFPGCGPTLH